MSITCSQVLAYAETKSQAATGDLNNTTTGIPFLNEALLDYRTTLINRGIDAAQTQESYINSVTAPGTGNGSTFAYPSDMFFLKTITVNMIDTNSQNYIQAQELDVSNTPDRTSFEWMRENQPNNLPLFDDRGDTYEIFPSFNHATNFTNAIRIFYFLTPTPYVNTSDVLTYPDTLDWYILALKVASLYYQSLNKFTEADYWEGKYKERLERLITSIGRGSQQPIDANPLQITGWQF